MLIFRILLALCNIHNLVSQSIYFVLTYLQADLDVDIWMELTRGSVINEVSYWNSCSYILKFNKILYGLKQSSLNWYENLPDSLISLDWVPSLIDSCFYLKYGTMILTYVYDCIITGLSIKDIDSFIHSMQNGPENSIFTDEVDDNMFIGVEITKDKDYYYEISQPFLIDRLLSVLGLSSNEFETNPNTSSTILISQRV